MTRSNTWFLQDWGTFPSETLVVVGLTQEQILARMKKSKFNADIHKAFGKCKSDDSADAYVWYWNGKTVLRFREWRNDWEHINTLLHETSHLIYHIIRDKGMENEIEAQAYQHEYLFDRTRRRLCAKARKKSK